MTSTASKGLLDAVLDRTATRRAAAKGRLDAFLAEKDTAKAVAIWLGLGPDDPVPSREEITASMTLDAAALARTIGRQIDAILHHDRFQGLESTWRSVRKLLDVTAESRDIHVKLFSASWRELAKDMERAIEFDQSTLFKRVYSDEFGTPGGEPFGVLLADYEVAHRPRQGHPVDDARVLRSVAQVAAAAFAPFLVGADATLFGVDTFGDLERPIDLAKVFGQAEYTAWNSLRDHEDSRFVGVVFPRVLVRPPYVYDPSRPDGLPYEEDVSAADGTDYLWGNACFAFGAVLARAFADAGWLAEIRGVVVGEETGGLVTNLERVGFGLEALEDTDRPSLELIVTDAREKAYADLGLIPLCACQGTPYAAFYTSPSLHRPGDFSGIEATRNARLSAMLQYVFCVSRIAHYVKMICRDKVGAYQNARELERFLREWLQKFCVSGEDVSRELQARFPLKQADVEIREVPGKPGTYSSVIRLLPHFQLDQMTSSIRLVTEVQTGK